MELAACLDCGLAVERWSGEGKYVGGFIVEEGIDYFFHNGEQLCEVCYCKRNGLTKVLETLERVDFPQAMIDGIE